METEDAILIAADVHREFVTSSRRLPVLQGVDLSVNQGEMVAISGASGVGKSTLLHILGGLDRPTKGEVTIGGVRLNNQSEQALARFRNDRVGFVFQFHYLLSDFTALENVSMPLVIAGKSHRQAAARGEQLLEMVGLEDRKDHLPRQLSGGEQQRVAVARALANDPDIVLADEPSGNLDIGTGRRLHELLSTLNQDFQTTFLIATHNPELAEQCHRHLEIKDGIVRQRGELTR